MGHGGDGRSIDIRVEMTSQGRHDRQIRELPGEDQSLSSLPKDLVLQVSAGINWPLKAGQGERGKAAAG
jgi:hypothetical protein